MQNPKTLSKLDILSKLCFKTARTVLIIINLITLVLASIFIYFSLTTFSLDYELDAAFSGENQPKLVHTYVSVICAGLGFIVALLALLGLIGAIRKSKSGLGAYVIIVAITIVLLLGMALYTYSLSNSSSASANRQLDKSFVNSTIAVYQYVDSSDLKTRMIDNLQRSFSCCGVNSPTDWTEFSPSHRIPKSCCSEPVESALPIYKYCAKSDHETGCWRALLSYFHSNLPIFRTVLYILTAFGLVCTLMAAFMIRVMKNSLDVV